MKKTDAFTVPSLADADAEYAAIEKRIADLGADAAKTRDDIAALEQDMRDRPTPRVHADVAALLGESVDQSLLERHTVLRRLRQHAAAVDDATQILQRKLIDQRGPASVAACKAVRAEYAKRLAAVVEAMQKLAVATAAAEEVVDGLEREGVQMSYLPAMRPTFLGHPKDGQMARFIREASETFDV